MKKWNAYIVYADDGRDAYRLVVPAPNKKDAEEFAKSCSMNVVTTKVMEDFYINTNYLASVMTAGHFGQDEIDVVTRMLNKVGIGI